MNQKSFLVALAFVACLLAYYIVPDALLRLNGFNLFKLNYPILYSQLIVSLISCVSILSFSGRIAFGLKFVNFNWWKIALIASCIEAIPFLVFLLSFLLDELYLSNWMLLSVTEIIMYHVILSPLIEEVFFRGVIQTFLSPLSSISFKYKRFTVSLSLAITSVLFTAIHFVNSFAAIVFIFSLGFFCGYLREKYQSIVPGIFAHFVFNTLAVLIPKLILVIDQSSK